MEIRVRAYMSVYHVPSYINLHATALDLIGLNLSENVFSGVRIEESPFVILGKVEFLR